MLRKYSAYLFLGICVGIILGTLPQSLDKLGPIETYGCDPEPAKILRSDFYNAVTVVKTCLAQYDRAEDLKFYSQRLQNPINLRCKSENHPAGLIALALDPEGDIPQTINVYPNEISSNEDIVGQSAILGHETIHLIGYSHFKNRIDLPYIVQMCCFDHRSDKLNLVGQKSCNLLKYNDVSWNDPEYVKRFTHYMIYFDHWFVSVVSSMTTASLSFDQTEDEFRSLEILRNTAYELLPDVMTKDKANNNSDHEAKSRKPAVDYILFSIIDSPNSQTQKDQIEKSYYQNQSQTLLKAYAEVLRNLIFNRDEDLIRSWRRFTGLQKSNCAPIKSGDLSALRDLAKYLKLPLKSKYYRLVQYGDPNKIFADWADICPLVKTKS